MPAHRKPTSVLQMSGAFAHDPARGRARADEPKPTGELGNPPTYLTQDEKKVWKEVRKTAHWLTDADRLTVEVLAKLMSKLRTGENLKAADFGCLRNLLGSLGMTPADRSRVQAPAKQDTKVNDEWGFLQSAGNAVRGADSKRKAPSVQVDAFGGSTLPN